MSSLTTKLAHLPPVATTPMPGLEPSALDIIRLIHPHANRSGVILASRHVSGWWQRCCTATKLADEVKARTGQEDEYVTLHRFGGRRSLDRLVRLQACHVDLDPYTVPAWRHHQPDQVTEMVRDTIAEARVPEPSMILFTGRGLHVIWLLDSLSACALPRWTAVQKELVALLQPFGADPAPSVATGCTRLVGTLNAVTKERVRPTFLSPHLLQHGHRWTLDAMAEHTLEFSRKQLAELKVIRQAKTAAEAAKQATAGQPKRPKPVTRRTTRSYCEAVIADLDRLRHLRGGGVLPPHHRNAWLLERAIAGAWLRTAADLEAEMIALAETWAGWSSKQTLSALSSVLRRARQAEKAPCVDADGAQADPRYRSGAARIVASLGITPAEMRGAGLRVLVDADRRKELAKERKQASRRRAGVVKRATYDQARTSATLLQARATLALVQDAGSVAAAALQAGISVGTMRKRRNRAAALLGAGHGAPR